MLDRTKNLERQLLSNAISARTEAARRVSDATATLERADHGVAGEEMQARELVEAQNAYVAAAEDATRAGRKAPAVPTNHATKRATASDRIATAVAIRAKFAGELATAKAALTNAERAVAEAIAPVLSAHADILAEQLMTAHREVWKHAARLRAIASIWSPSANGSLRPLQISAKARIAIDAPDPRESGFVPGTGPEARAVLAFRDLMSRLAQDASATLKPGDLE
jgi:hypothetical protein